MCTGMNCDGSPLERVYMIDGQPMCGVGANGLTHTQQQTRIAELEAMIDRFWGTDAVKRSVAAEDQNRDLRAALLSLVNSQETDLGSYAEFALATAQAALAGKELPG